MFVNKKESGISAECFKERLDQVKTESELRNTLQSIYSKDSASVVSSFSSRVEPSWSLFYQIVNKEKDFSLGHHASAYYAMNLLEPKLKAMWVKRDPLARKKWSEYGDFLTAVWSHIDSKLTPKMNKKGKMEGWMEEINDNFLAYISPELMTVLNEITAPEISKYLTATRGNSLHSLDELMENEDNPLQIADETCDVEAMVLDKIMHEQETAVINLVSEHNDNDTSQMITDALTASMLGLSEDDLQDIYEDSESEEGNRKVV